MAETFTYWGLNLVQQDGDLRSRVVACAAKEGIPEPEPWAYERRWEYAAAPGWADAYEYALATHPPVEGEPPYSPGKDATVITDAQILAQVQAMKTPGSP